jgi:hypothetical protein
MLMMDDPLLLLMQGIWLLAAGMYPLGFLFGSCSACCDPCPWFINFDRCMRVAVVGSDRPDGGDCRIAMSASAVGDVQYMETLRTGLGIDPTGFMEIYNIQSQITIPVRVVLGVIGPGLTPLGETRNQVWRFIVATPTVPPSNTASAYDEVGPPWHLQVDLTVTRVATIQEEEVLSSRDIDEHGQPKLILNIKQWTREIDHTEQVTLSPIGLQRWGAPRADIQNFRITSSTLTPTLVSGTSYFGWSVSKPTGMVISERALALRFLPNRSLCLGLGNVPHQIFLNIGTVLRFLKGEEDLRISVGAGYRDLRIMPNTPLCENTLLGIGVEMGVYPPEVYAEAPASVVELPGWCGKSSIALRLGLNPPSACKGSWSFGAVYRRPAFDFHLGLSVGIGDFFPGRSLLWNAEGDHPPYRTSFIADGPSGNSGPLNTTVPGWTYSISGEDTNLEDFFLSEQLGCAPGLVPAPRIINACVPPTVEVSYEAEVPLIGHAEFSTQVPPCQSLADPSLVVWTATYSQSGTQTLQLREVMSDSLRIALGVPPEIGNEQIVYYSGQIEFITPGEIETDGPWSGGNTATLSSGPNIGLANIHAYSIVDPCDDPNTLTLGARAFASINARYFNPELPGVPGLISTPTETENICFRFSGVTGPTQEWVPLFTPNVGDSEIRHRLKVVCDEWPTETVPAAGETLTRECDITDGAETVDTVTQTAVITGSQARFARRVGDDLTQLGRCRLLGLRRFDDIFFRLAPIVIDLLTPPTVGSCFVFMPVFGETDGQPCSGDGFTTVPCGCQEVTVAIIAGQENAIVQFIETGEKRGLIQVSVRRVYARGEGVTFSVSCGSSQVEQTIRFQPVVPSAPRNLTVVSRQPCDVVTLAWEPPSSNGGSPVTSYRIEFRIRGFFVWDVSGFVQPPQAVSPTVTATVEGLLRMPYEFRVFAINERGTSAASNTASSGIILEGPLGLTVTRDPCTEAVLSWLPGPDQINNSQSPCVVAVEYEINYREVGEGGAESFWIFGGRVPGTQLTATVFGLDEEKVYEFRVLLIDDLGRKVATDGLVVRSECPPPP